VRPFAGTRRCSHARQLGSDATSRWIPTWRSYRQRSAGKQGHAIAEAALFWAGAAVTIDLRPGEQWHRSSRCENSEGTKSARDMLARWKQRDHADVAVFAAAVATGAGDDTAAERSRERQARAPALSLVENPDIL